jgi:hypothetical protein
MVIFHGYVTNNQMAKSHSPYVSITIYWLDIVIVHIQVAMTQVTDAASPPPLRRPSVARFRLFARLDFHPASGHEGGDMPIVIHPG